MEYSEKQLPKGVVLHCRLYTNPFLNLQHNNKCAGFVIVTT
jgi:hypothetical protein